MIPYLVTHLEARWPLIPLWGLIVLLHLYRDGQILLWTQQYAVLLLLLILCPFNEREKRRYSGHKTSLTDLF